MESSSFDITVTPILESIQPLSPENPSLDGFFSIHFHFNHLTISSTSNDPKNLIFNFITPIYDYFLIPPEILCNYNEQTIMDAADLNTFFLFGIFRDVPDYILKKVLSEMGDCARKMVALNIEGCGMLEMNVLLRMVTTLDVDDDELDQYYQSSICEQNVGWSPKLNVETTSSNSTDQCSICLGEFRDGSQSELFYTRCSHVFHKECIAKWIYGCIDRSSSYSCPLCRHQLM